MPLKEELPSDGEAWYKWYGEKLNSANFRLRVTKGDWGFVNYTDNDGLVEMYLSSMEGHTIEGADFIQSPIIPGETTFADSVDALGIRDVITAMGIQGDAFKDASLDFKSQFSEKAIAKYRVGMTVRIFLLVGQTGMEKKSGLVCEVKRM